MHDFVGEVPPDVNVLGTFTSSKNIFTPFYARSVVLIYRGRLQLTKSKAAQKVQEPAADTEQYSASAIELAAPFSGLLHLRLPHN